MPGENIYDWSITAANNGTADTSINFAEGQPRASVNNSARSMMAAHAKKRDLQNGSITTGGTANAQTFTSGIGYTSVPTGIMVLLKIGAALTNTGAATLDMDGIGDISIKDTRGEAIVAGDLTAGSYAEFLYDGTNWILLRRGATSGGGVSGKFGINSATVAAFTPYNGNTIKIAGILYELPAAGISATITNCYADGIAGSSLIVGNIYNVYVFNNAGTLTLDFSTTAHTIDTSVGNIGIEIKSGDPTRSLVGKVAIVTGPAMSDSENFRGVLTWFNRRPRVAKTTYSGTTSSPVLVDAGSATYFMSWGDEDISFALAGNTYNDFVGVTNYTNLYLDNTSYILPDTTWSTSEAVNSFDNIAGSYWVRVTEGRHFFIHRVACNGGTGVWNVNSFVQFNG